MATNKHAMVRYQALDKCLSNPSRKYYIETLVETCSKAIYEMTGSNSGIKRRQVLEDIKFMESTQGWNAPIERIRNGHRVYFRYEDKKFSINNQPLNELEQNQLKEALLTLSRFKGMPQFGWIDEMLARIDSGSGLSRGTQRIIQFDQNSYLKGLEYITPLYNAIIYKIAIDITYKNFKQEVPQTIVLHPYFLKQYNNRWYVFGKNDTIEYLMNLALDRIDHIKESKQKYIPNTSINFDEYFEDIIGVTVGNEATVEHIVLRVSNSLLPYIKTKPIHGSQKLKEQRLDHTLISLDLIPNYELESLMLFYGEGIEVLEPASLRNKISERLKAAVSRYNI